MIKSLNRDDIQVTPFTATKTWILQNTDNDDLILWISGSLSGSISHTYIDYGDGTSSPITNSYCDLALQQQENQSYVLYQRGIKNESTFYPEGCIYYNSGSNPRNTSDNSYMSIVYNTNKQLFYNTYDNPTQIWGLESINLNNTIRILTDVMDVFSLNKSQFGEKIVPNSVSIQDDFGEIKYTIVDDGNTHLILQGKNFSTFQMVTFESEL
jgi:hypothetical protein